MRFGKVSPWVVENPEIHPTAKAIYAIISASADGETGVADLTISLIVERVGIDRKQVKAHLKELERGGIIKRLSTGNRRARWAIAPCGKPFEENQNRACGGLHTPTEGVSTPPIQKQNGKPKTRTTETPRQPPLMVAYDGGRTRHFGMPHL